MVDSMTREVFAIGTPVELRSTHRRVPAGTWGRVSGYWLQEPTIIVDMGAWGRRTYWPEELRTQE